MADPDTWRIVLLGKTGSGKSSLGNTLLRENTFKVGHEPNSETKLCKSETGVINGRKVHLVDTPGLLDTDIDNDETIKELMKSIVECAPGPHAFLLVMMIGRFTAQEKMVEQILKIFSEEALRFTTIVFTHGNELQDSEKIEDWAKKNEELRVLLQKCGGRCHVIDNKYWNNSQDPYRNNTVQVTELLKTMGRTVKENGGTFYTNKMLEMVQRDIEDNVKSGQTFKEAKESTYMHWLKILGLVAVGVAVGAGGTVGFFVGGPVGVAVGGAVGVAVGVAVGGAVGVAVRGAGGGSVRGAGGGSVRVGVLLKAFLSKETPSEFDYLLHDKTL